MYKAQINHIIKADNCFEVKVELCPQCRAKIEKKDPRLKYGI